MKFVTREKPKVDRVACPWLISRFIDRGARFLFVEPDYVADVAEELGAIAYDIKGAAFTHVGEACTFDTLIDAFDVTDPYVRELQPIVRGADTARMDLAPEAAGLAAVSFGISALSRGDDDEALRHGFTIYDALYAWRKFSAGETHNWPSAARERAA